MLSVQFGRRFVACPTVAPLFCNSSGQTAAISGCTCNGFALLSHVLRKNKIGRKRVKCFTCITAKDNPLPSIPCTISTDNPLPIIPYIISKDNPLPFIPCIISNDNPLPIIPCIISKTNPLPIIPCIISHDNPLS